MTSIKGLTRHSSVINPTACLRKLGCRNLASCWIRTFFIIFFCMLVWMQFVIRNTGDDENEIPRRIRGVNGFSNQASESLRASVNKTKIKQNNVLMKKIMKHNKNLTNENPLENTAKVIVHTRLEEEDVIILDNTKSIRTKNSEPDSIKFDNETNNEERTKEKLIRVEYIKLKIEVANKKQIIYNAESFGYLNNDSLVILVQVHNRANYLQHLIDSLAKARDIDQALLIFSHDIYDEEINNLVKAIKFCKVMQIFFPYSIETHPGSFPGNDPRDCPRDIEKKKALQIGCLNAEHSDKYGHYRESKYTQIKHHWWWKMNHVFNHLNVTSKYSGFVLFLEEDHYVTEDFIHVLKLMGPLCHAETFCEFLGLGLNTKSGSSDQARTSLFLTNLGLAFNREAYLNSIKSCAKEFCEFDDYNWDWSLNYITNKCGKDPKLSMIPMAQRVFHIGECGTHVQNPNCDVEKALSDVRNRIKSLDLYPSTIKLIQANAVKPKIMENGGWGDKRDHQLCINMTHTP